MGKLVEAVEGKRSGDGSKPAGPWFQDGAETEDLVEVLGGPSLDLNAAVALVPHKPFGGEAPQRFPNGGSAHPEGIREIPFSQPVPTLPGAGEDLGTDERVRMVGRMPGVGCGHLATHTCRIY